MRRLVIGVGAVLCAQICVIIFGVLHGGVAQGSEPAAAPAPVKTFAVIGGVPTALYIPKNLNTDVPVQVVVALHGMGGSGAEMIQQLAADADANGWVIAAPNLPYSSNYKDAAVLTREDPELTARLVKMQDDLPNALEMPVNPRAFYYGFSRGAQIVHRFALFYPERVAAVAAIAAGSYTLPISGPTPSDGFAKILPYPYGTANFEAAIHKSFSLSSLQRVRFDIEVGSMDTLNQDVPREWDNYEGKNRLARAKSFVQALKSVGVAATIKVYPGTGHGVTPQMTHDASIFFRQTQQGTTKNAA